MKKALVFTLSILLSISVSAPVLAATNAVGSYYYTDIVTYLWDTPINAINIGGETLIDAEAMAYYGFTVTWDAAARRLEITDNQTCEVLPKAKDGSLLDMKNGVPGSAAGKYYRTDIKTTLNGKEITAFNIGGRTFIGAEAMVNFGYRVIWDPDFRTLSIQSGKSDDASAGWLSGAVLPFTDDTYGHSDMTIKSFGMEFTNFGDSETPNFKVTVSFGDADLFEGLGITNSGFSHSFYQAYPSIADDTGVFFDSFASDGGGYPGVHPDSPELRERLRQVLRLFVNGEEISGKMARGSGNGHWDWYFEFDKNYKPDEIETFYIEFGSTVYYTPKPGLPPKKSYPVLTTDARALIDEAPITVYVLENNPVIFVEDLTKYGLSLTKNPETGAVDITKNIVAFDRNQDVRTPIVLPETDKKAGDMVALATLNKDKIITVRGQLIPSFDMNGKTVIFLADMTRRLSDYTSYNWSSSNKTINVYTEDNTDDLTWGFAENKQSSWPGNDRGSDNRFSVEIVPTNSAPWFEMTAFTGGTGGGVKPNLFRRRDDKPAFSGFYVG